MRRQRAHSGAAGVVMQRLLLSSLAGLRVHPSSLAGNMAAASAGAVLASALQLCSSVMEGAHSGAAASQRRRWAAVQGWRVGATRRRLPCSAGQANMHQ